MNKEKQRLDCQKISLNNFYNKTNKQELEKAQIIKDEIKANIDFNLYDDNLILL